jgi:hypothetical protein
MECRIDIIKYHHLPTKSQQRPSVNITMLNIEDHEVIPPVLHFSVHRIIASYLSHRIGLRIMPSEIHETFTQLRLRRRKI